MLSKSSATEFAILTFKAGIDLDSNPAAQTWEDVKATISAQEGYQRSHFGRQLESPNISLLLIDWNDVDSHMKFINSPQYGPFKQKVNTLIEDLAIHHFIPSPFPPTILGRAPCTEVATFYNVTTEFASQAQAFGKAVGEGKPDGYIGFSHGPVVEEISKSEGDEKGSAYVLLVGWESKEKHMAFRETELFKKNIPLLREEHGGVTVCHVPFQAI